MTHKLLELLTPTNNGCLEFIGSRSDGYGTIRHNGAVVKAHRLSWELQNGPIPTGMLVLHSCDNPPCCNVEHLFLGTHQDNSDDMIDKGRDKHDGIAIQGELNGRAILKEQDVIEIRKLLDEGHTQQLIADMYNVTREAIKKIKLKQSWRHIL